jgi:hypothetical protein
MKSFKLLLLACVWVNCAAAGAEKVECDLAMTIDTCTAELVIGYSRTLRAEATSKSTKATAAAKADVPNTAERNDQPGTASGGPAKSTFTDLIPWLNMLGVLSDSDESDGTIAVDLNFLLRRKRHEEVKHDSQLNWEIDVSPTPFEALVNAIPEDVRDERTKNLQKDIDETADSRLQYTYSVVTKNYGRDFRQHHDEFAALIAPLVVGAEVSAGATLDNSFDVRQSRFAVGITRLVEGLKLPAGVSNDDTDKSKLPIEKFSEDERKRINDFIQAARDGYAQDLAKHLDAIQKAVSDTRISQMADLVLQQPQILIAATKSFRDELVGPESWGIKFTFERSFADFTRFKKFAANYRRPGTTEDIDACAMFDTTSRKAQDTAKIPKVAGDSHTCLDALGAYQQKNAAQIENGSRWKLGLEYKQVDDWRYSLPTDGVDLDLPKHDRIVALAGFGRAINRSESKDKDRVDFEAAYDSNLKDDTTYKSRFVATLTYTRRFRDMDIPFSIVYANKSEFLEGTDKQIGLHFGIKYRALDKE